MDRADANIGGNLQHHWDSAYTFEYDTTPGVGEPFRVRHRDDESRTLKAEALDALGHMIDEHYRRERYLARSRHER